MTFIDRLSKLLLTPSVSGWRAFACSLALIVVPTLIRLWIGLYLDRLPFSVYVPFVILAAILLDWRWAVGTAFFSWLVADYLFVAPAFQFSLTLTSVVGFVVFMTCSGMIVGLAKAVRFIVDNSLRPARPNGFSAPVIFSLEDGQAWASWNGSHSWVLLGPEDEVAEMMADFLAQRELAERLNQSGSSRANP